MTSDQYTELIGFLNKKFGRIDQRFDQVEGRLTRVEVRLETLGDDIRLLADGLSMTNERLDRYHQDHHTRIRALEDNRFRN